MADKIVVLRDGRVEQVGAPLELYRDPDNRFVAGFIGSPSMNFLECAVVDGQLSHPALGAPVALPVAGATAGLSQVTLGLRPEHIEVVDADPTLRVELVEALGGVSYAHLSGPDAARLIVEERGDARSTVGRAVGIRFDPHRAMLFDPESGQRLR